MRCQLILGGLLAVSAYAQIHVTGRVISETFAPIADASLTLRSAASGERFRTITGPGGAFSFDVPTAGEYRADVERSGYFTLQNQRVEIAAGTELQFTLNPVREFADSVDVSSASTAVALDRTTSENRLSGAELLDVPYPTTHNFKNAMRILPGVVQDSTGGIHVNGGGENQVLYLMDGFNIADPLTGTLESRVSVESVQSMEVMSGRVSAEYGKGSAGVLSVNTKLGDDRLRYSATNFVPGVESAKGWRVGSWSPRANLSGPIRKGRAWFSDSLITQYDQTVVNELPPGQDASTSWRYSNILRGQVNLTPSNILYAGFLANQFSAARTGLTPLDPAETTVDRRARQWFYDLKDQMYFGRGALVELGYASNHTFARQIPQGQDYLVLTPTGRRGNFFVNGTQGASRDQVLANLFLPAFTAFGEHQLKGGLDFNRLSYDQDLNRTGFEYYNATSLVRRVTFAGNGRFGTSNIESATYVQDSWRLRKNVLLELGVRGDWDQILRNWNFSPRVGVAWSPPRLENTKISAGYATTYDATNLQLFTRSLDQSPVTTYYPPYGTGEVAVQSLFLVNGRHYSSPRFYTWSGSIDQRLASNLFIKVQGMRRRGSRGLTYREAGLNSALIYALTNARTDAYDSMEFTFRHNLRKQYEWMASYTRSRAVSNAVVDLTIDQPALVGLNYGRLPWDAPNRLVSWGYLPTPWQNWAVAYLAEYRTGFPFFAQDDVGRIVGNVSSFRYPDFFELNLHVERKFRFRGQLWAARVGMNNISGHRNPNAVINDIDSPRFGTFSGGQSRATVVRIRWLGKS